MIILIKNNNFVKAIDKLCNRIKASILKSDMDYILETLIIIAELYYDAKNY